MPNRYRISGVAELEASATEDVLLEIILAVNSNAKLVGLFLYPNAPASTNGQIVVRAGVATAAAVGGGAATITKADPNIGTCRHTAKVKDNAGGNFAEDASFVEQRSWAFSNYSYLEWMASENDPPIYQEAAGAATYINVLAQCDGVAALKLRYTAIIED